MGIYFIDCLIVLPDVFGIIESNGLKQLDVFWFESVVDLEEAESIGVPAESTGQMGRVFPGGESARGNVGRMDAECFKLLRPDEAKGILLPERF